LYCIVLSFFTLSFRIGHYAGICKGGWWGVGKRGLVSVCNEKKGSPRYFQSLWKKTAGRVFVKPLFNETKEALLSP
jgi:hypothetical protein